MLQKSSLRKSYVLSKTERFFRAFGSLLVLRDKSRAGARSYEDGSGIELLEEVRQAVSVFSGVERQDR